MTCIGAKVKAQYYIKMRPPHCLTEWANNLVIHKGHADELKDSLTKLKFDFKKHGVYCRVGR